ncbi:zinc finger MYM-type protein 1-like [Myzus persicae]|uniref:zinc finger MYM-type protein 1-like n=1 Tax=Myzus persicae TaxID=13164 RepID=UPI000B9359FC|nr:zinc finger MYM-type protein 1-like [Myzus persicae]
MSNRQFESGASKRRRKNIQNNELKKYKGLMNNFVFINSEVELKAQDNPEIVVNESIKLQEEEQKVHDQPDIIIITNEENVCQSKNTQSSVEQKVESNHENIEIVNELYEHVNQINKNESMEIQGLNLLHDYPTDQAHFLGITLTSVIKRSIIEYGPCRPKIEFPRNEDKRKFSINGIDNWQHLSQKIFKHESSIQHIESVKIRSLWTKNKVLDSQLENQVSEEAAFWRSVLERIIMIILHLTSGNTALRGNEGKFSSKNQFSEGNFLQTVRLVANYDPILSKLINCEKSKIKYLSHTIVDELIGILSSDLLKTICNEIKLCQCFSIIMDSTLDITKLDQLSVIIRYTVINFEEKKLEVKESFVGFFELKHHGAADYTQMICEILSKLDLDINRCRGQGYDGASVMSGVHSGVQTRIKELVPSASYIHCCSHNLNLVISDAAKCHSKVLNFFDTVQAIFNFFASSAPRWALIAFGHDISIKIRTKVLKKVCPTRWEARHDAIFSLKERYIDVLKSLTYIILTSNKTSEKTLASGLKKKLETFEFILILCMWEPILRSLRIVSKRLQNINMDLEAASNMIQMAVTSTQDIRDNYQHILIIAKELCKKWNIPVTYPNERKKQAVKYFDEIDGDPRFKGTNEVVQTFSFLNPTSFVSKTEKEVVNASYDFILKYSNDISTDFTRQLLSLRTSLQKHQLKTIKNLAI